MKLILQALILLVFEWYVTIYQNILDSKIQKQIKAGKPLSGRLLNMMSNDIYKIRCKLSKKQIELERLITN